jgi:oxygen-independent coproporphyrinogen-3 oxidase
VAKPVRSRPSAGLAPLPAAAGPLGVYLHVPFCGAICNYCNFNRGLLDEALKARYVEALVRHVASSGDRGAAVDTIFFGGGTPSLLTPAEVAAVLAACRTQFAVAPGAEVTLEANPESATAERLAGYRAAGVTRLSFGVQSFHDDELRRLGRLHDAAAARDVVPRARAAGFEDVSLDLMMWLPGQTVAQWLASVDALVAAGPDHASLYLLEIYPNAPLRDEMARGGWSVAPDDDAAAMYLEAMARLEAAGYAQYEISNVARPGHRARHNLKYWQDGEWLAFGCGAHGTRHGRRWRNVAGTGEYVARVEAGEDVVAEVRELTATGRVEEALFMGLRLSEGLDLPAFQGRYGVDVWARHGDELARFVSAGLLTHEPGRRLALTRQGMLLANEIMMVFIDADGTVK